MLQQTGGPKKVCQHIMKTFLRRLYCLSFPLLPWLRVFLGLCSSVVCVSVLVDEVESVIVQALLSLSLSLSLSPSLTHTHTHTHIYTLTHTHTHRHTHTHTHKPTHCLVVVVSVQLSQCGGDRGGPSTFGALGELHSCP